MHSPSNVHTRSVLRYLGVRMLVIISFTFQCTYPSLEHETKPIPGTKARPRTASVCPWKTLISFPFFHNRIVLSAAPIIVSCESRTNHQSPSNMHYSYLSRSSHPPKPILPILQQYVLSKYNFVEILSIQWQS